jgi:hypothetical protein
MATRMTLYRNAIDDSILSLSLSLSINLAMNLSLHSQFISVSSHAASSSALLAPTCWLSGKRAYRRVCASASREADIYAIHSLAEASERLRGTGGRLQSALSGDACGTGMRKSRSFPSRLPSLE